jgi:hypothetical protein
MENISQKIGKVEQWKHCLDFRVLFPLKRQTPNHTAAAGRFAPLRHAADS